MNNIVVVEKNVDRLCSEIIAFLERLSFNLRLFNIFWKILGFIEFGMTINRPSPL